MFIGIKKIYTKHFVLCIFYNYSTLNFTLLKKTLLSILYTLQKKIKLQKKLFFFTSKKTYIFISFFIV
jgi:hypothetical protein